MRKVIAIFALTLASVFAVSAQTTQTNNEGFVGYTFYTSDVEGKVNNVSFDKKTDAHGFNAAYTRYFAGANAKASNTVGFTADLGVNFNGKNEASLVTVMGGLTAKARNNKYIQPYVNALAGVSRQNVRINNVTEFSDVAPAFALGGGLSFNLAENSRYKFTVGADYLNTGFNGQRQGGARVKAGFNF